MVWFIQWLHTHVQQFIVDYNNLPSELKLQLLGYILEYQHDVWLETIHFLPFSSKQSVIISWVSSCSNYMVTISQSLKFKTARKDKVKLVSQITPLVTSHQVSQSVSLESQVKSSQAKSSNIKSSLIGQLHSLQWP